MARPACSSSLFSVVRMSSRFAISPLALHPGHYFVRTETPVLPEAISRQGDLSSVFWCARIPKKPAPSKAWQSPAPLEARCGFHLRCSSLWPPAVECCADKTLCAVTAQLGWSDPTNYFGHGNVHKSGVAPAQSGVLSAPKLIVAPCATSSASDSSENPRVNRKGDDGVNCVFHAPFTFKDCYLPGKWTAFAPKIHLRIQPARLSYYIEGKNPAKPHRENQRNRRECPLSIERQKKPKM